MVIGITITIYTNQTEVPRTLLNPLCLVVHHVITAKQLTKRYLMLSVLIGHQALFY